MVYIKYINIYMFIDIDLGDIDRRACKSNGGGCQSKKQSEIRLSILTRVKLLKNFEIAISEQVISPIEWRQESG